MADAVFALADKAQDLACAHASSHALHGADEDMPAMRVAGYATCATRAQPAAASMSRTPRVGAMKSAWRRVRGESASASRACGFESGQCAKSESRESPSRPANESQSAESA